MAIREKNKWSLYTKDNSIDSLFVELNKKLFTNVEDIVKQIRLKFQRKKSFEKRSEFSKVVRINHPNNCADVDIMDIAEREGISLTGFNQIQFDFEDVPLLTVEVKLQDRASSLSRAFKYNKFSTSGPAVKFQSLTNPKIR